MKGVVYNGVRMMPGSECLALYEAREFPKLHALMKTIARLAQERGEFL